MPEVALLLAEPSGLLRDLMQHAAHPVLALVVAGDGEHERVAAEFGEEVREVLRGRVGRLHHVGALVHLGIDAQPHLARAEIHELPHPLRVRLTLGVRVELRLDPGHVAHLLGQAERGELLHHDRPVLLLALVDD